MIDSHAHVTRCREPVEQVLARAREAGLERILTVGLDEATNREELEVARANPEVFVAVGRHPNSAEGFDDDAAGDLRELARDERVVAIGETGLDFYRDTADPESQRVAFEAQIVIAAEAGLPIVIHVRDREGEDRAVEEVFRRLDAAPARPAVILHCFSAPGWVDRAAERGWYCSFAGNVTYPRNEELRRAAAAVPEHLILAETDAPYLSPQPVRGKPNTPANVLMTAAVLAEARGVEPAELERTVTANAARVFGW